MEDIPPNDIVNAYKIDKIHIHVKCPKCKRDHLYGSCNDFTDRIETRICHCPFYEREIDIVIDDTTERIRCVRPKKYRIK